MKKGQMIGVGGIVTLSKYFSKDKNIPNLEWAIKIIKHNLDMGWENLNIPDRYLETKDQRFPNNSKNNGKNNPNKYTGDNPVSEETKALARQMDRDAIII